MTHAIPNVQNYMTRCLFVVTPETTLLKAHEIMRENDLRHLPVVDEGILVGMLSQSDLHLIETLRDVDPRSVPVEDAMARDVFEANPSASVGVVASEMASRKVGSAVIIDQGEVVGVFTTTDALRALADLCMRLSAA